MEAGEIVGLIGPNGAGKTTVFNLVSGALMPDSGAIRFKGASIAGLKPHQIARMGIARTFQSVKIFSKMSVSENVHLGHLFGRAKGSVLSDPARGETGEILDFVGLAGLKEARAMDLILGEPEEARGGAGRSRLSPDLLLLDEVMAGLTPTEVAESHGTGEADPRERGDVLMIEHVMKAIMSICDRIIVLHHGEKIAEGTPQEIVRIER